MVFYIVSQFMVVLAVAAEEAAIAMDECWDEIGCCVINLGQLGRPIPRHDC